MFLNGCGITMSVSKYHIGYHNLGDNRQAYSTVAKNLDLDTNEFEKMCINIILNQNLNELKNYCAPKLKNEITNNVIDSINLTINSVYKFSGDIEPIIMNEKKYEFTESSDNYNIYDFVRGDYKLLGNPGAILRLFTTKIDGKIMLSGFSLLEDNVENKKNRIDILFPETVDKANLLNSFGTTFEKIHE